MWLLLHIENIYHDHYLDLLLLFSFLYSLENQYMIHHVYNLSCDICNATVELKQSFLSNIIIILKITNSYWFVIIFFLPFKKVLISLNILSSIALFSFVSSKRFIIFLIMLSSNCFNIFNLLGFFPPPCFVVTYFG